MFKWVVSRTSKLVGRNVNSTFFTATYREIFKELLEITKDETEAAKIMKKLGKQAAFESANRQSSIMKFFPNDPIKILGDAIPLLWQILFGTKMENFKLIEQKVEDSDYPTFIYQISNCPICSGYGTLPEDTINCSKIDSKESNYASGLIGMLEQTGNFILEIKGHNHRINITETKCFCRGDDYMELYCQIVPKEDFRKITEEAITVKKSSTFDIDLDKIESILSKPMDAIKDQVTKLIQDKMQMTSEELFDHFRNYEDDVIRIIGFFLVHLINENGRLVEKAAKNETFSKVIAHLYNVMVEMTNIYIPKEIIADYQALLVEFLSDLAPDEMVESFKRFNAPEIITLFFEGMEKAFQDLGVNFETAKPETNIWEELEMQEIVDKIPIGKKFEKDSSDEEKRRVSEIQLKIIQEIFLLIASFVSIPIRMMIASGHGTIKSALTSSDDVFENLRNHAENLMDFVERLK